MLSHNRVVYDGSNPPKPRPQRQWPPGINGEACELLFGGLTKLKERVMGDRRHVCKSSKFSLTCLACCHRTLPQRTPH